MKPALQDYEGPVSPCPTCGKGLDRHLATRASSGPPRPGDYTLCAYCGVLLLFTEDMGVRLATGKDEERVTNEDRETLNRLQERIRDYPLGGRDE